MRSSGSVGLAAWLVREMVALVAAYAVVLVLPGDVSSTVEGLLGIAAVWTSAAVCWLVVVRVGFRDRELLCAAAAVTSFGAGLTYYGVLLTAGGTVPPLSPADVGQLLFYPLMLAAVDAAVRRHVRVLASSVWWDVAVGSLGAATVLAVLLRPVLDPALAGSPSLATAVAIAYPLSDLALVAAVAGIGALRSVCAGPRWGLLIAGLLVFTAADVIYALQRAAGVFVAGRPLDAGWAIGLALVALWVDGTARGDGPTMRPESGAANRSTVLVVPVVATAAALVVLATAAWVPLSKLAVVLAVVTLLVAAARTQVAFGQLARMADLRRLETTTDLLTGLLNRRALTTAVHARLAERDRRRALLVLNLDKFREVNDALGHHIGDLLLSQVGARLRAILDPTDLLARVGGDEFAVLLADAGHDETEVTVTRLRTVLAEAYTLEGVALHSAASIGIALFPDDGPDLATLLRKADIAMYRAKATCDGHHFYGTGDDSDVVARMRTIGELRTAIVAEQFVLHYQPKIDLPTGHVHSVEALVRWNHPTRGLLFPDAFITLVEEVGLMPAMTRLVLATALDQVVTWQGKGRHLTVAVNVSASSLVDAALPDQVAAMLTVRGIPSSALQIEITEDALMVDRARARAILTRLREGGVQISVDDFGTGYSSLSYLRDLPIDELKLDQSFIFPMADDTRAAALVASTIDLAHSLDVRMVAEGVETQAIYTELRRLGCDQAQGYYMSRPIPAAAFETWLSNRPAGKSPADLPLQRTYQTG